MQLLLLLLLTISYFKVISSRISGAFNIAIIGELDNLIHTLRVEGDEMNTLNVSDAEKFQSTPSVWRVTAKVYKQNINQFLFLSIKNKILTFVEKTNVNIYSCIL